MHGILLAFDMPEDWWCARMGREFPDMESQFLNLVRTGPGRCIETIHLHGSHAPDAVKWMETHGILTAGLLLEQDADGATVRLQMAGCPLDEAIEATATVPMFPFTVRGREVRWLLTDGKETTRALMDWLRSHRYSPRTVRAGHWLPEQHALTKHQERVFRDALKWGYYEYPRRISLTAMARRIGVSKSTLSETVMVIEHKIMTTHRPGLALPRLAPARKGPERHTVVTAR